MKKQLTAALLIFAILLTMAGCSTANAVQKLDAAEDMVEAKLDAVEEQVESSLRNAASPVPAPTEPVPTSPPAKEISELTEEQAQQVALEYLGFAADQVTRLHSSYEMDDGIPQFDVEFHQGDWEYEFEIHAENGRILSYDKDHKYD